jgi:hypothetical protein
MAATFGKLGRRRDARYNSRSMTRKSECATDADAASVDDAAARRLSSADRSSPAQPPLRLLVVTGNLALLRGHYEGVITRLVRAGVHVSIRYLKDSSLSVAEYSATLREQGVEIDARAAPRRSRRPSDVFALRLRELGNILRYSHPDYAGKVVLAERALEKTGAGAQFWGRAIRRLGPRLAMRVARLVARLESTLPAPTYASDLLAEERPDVVAVVPVIRAPVLVDYLKAALEQGVGTSIWVQSWDNLTNKGLLHFAPDKVFVWNESQRAELSRYHRVGAGRVCVTGAQTFDHWFSGGAVLDRSEFCAELGVDPDRPIILYLASSKGIAPEEPTFFARWLEAVRSSDDPVLRSATVLLRPHPTLAEAWHSHHFDQQPGVVVSPATIRDQLNSNAFREQYRTELHHSSLVFGINTSGVIDAAIFGKPAFTVELPELFHGQKGTVHFDHLAESTTGLLRTASSLHEHVTMLSQFVNRDPYEHDDRAVAFIRMFVRPGGRDSQPAELFVEELLALCRTRTELTRTRGAARAVGWLTSFAVDSAWTTLHLPKRLARSLRRLVRRARRLLRLRTNLRRAYRFARRLLRPLRRALRRIPRPVRDPLRRVTGAAATPAEDEARPALSSANETRVSKS